MPQMILYVVLSFLVALLGIGKRGDSFFTSFLRCC